MNNTRNDESPGHPHQCSVCQTAGHATLDNGVESKSWAQSNRTTNCRAVQCVLIFMARTVQQSEQQAAAKSAAKATMEALKSCCIQLGAVQCTHTQAAGHKDSPTHPHTHTLSTCVTRVWISALVHHPLHMGKWNPRFAPKPLVRKPSLMELPSPPAGQHFVCVLCPRHNSPHRIQIPGSRVLCPAPRASATASWTPAAIWLRIFLTFLHISAVATEFSFSFFHRCDFSCLLFYHFARSPFSHFWQTAVSSVQAEDL